jgi:DNA-binding MarR family transcriptional regulator
MCSRVGEQEKQQVSRETVEAFIRAFTQFKRNDLHPSTRSALFQNNSEAKLLILLHDGAVAEGMKVSDLSSQMRVTSPFVTQLLTSTEERGLVRRQVDPSDRRMVRVFLTEEGRQAALVYKRELYGWFSELAQHLGEEDSQQLTRLLNRIFDYMQDMRKS